MIYRFTEMQDKWYAIEVDLEDDVENINQLVSEGSTVVIAEDIETFCSEYGVKEGNIILV